MLGPSPLGTISHFLVQEEDLLEILLWRTSCSVGSWGTGCCLYLDFFHPIELHLRRQLSFSEDSDLSSDDILERSSQKSKREVGRPSP